VDTNNRVRGAAALDSYPLVDPLLTRRVNTQLIAENWDEILRLAVSRELEIRARHRLADRRETVPRRPADTLAAALKEYGALRRTIYAARYLSREDYRRRISRQLNKGESIHALRRDVFYAHEGAVRRRHPQHQTEQAWCLTLATNAVIAWTTEYLGLAVTQFRAQGRRIDDVLLAHISPARSEDIGLFGTITVDIDHELAQLDATGHRPPETVSTPN
jgi:TnpA family transposase